MSKKDVKPIYKNKLVVIVSIFISVIVLGTVIPALLGSDDTPTSRIAPANKIEKDITSSAGTDKASEKYNEQIEEYSKEKSDEALKKSDGSYIQQVTNEEKAPSLAEKNANNSPISISPRKPKDSEVIVKREVVVDNTQIEKLKLELEKSRQELMMEKERTQQMLITKEENRQRSVYSANSERLKQEKENINNVFNRYLVNFRETVPGEPEVKVFSSYQEPELTESDSNETGQEGNAKDAPSLEGGVFSVGEILYAENKIAINTDYSSRNVVVAEVISEKESQNGAKLFGSFSLIRDSLVLEFNKIKLPNNEVIQIKGYAIDEQDYIATVRSDYDNHYLERYGLFFAGSFVKGLAGSVVTKVGQNSTVVYDQNGNPVGQTSGDYEMSSKDSLIIAGGEVASEASEILKNNLNREPTVTLDYGKTFGIIIMEVQGK